MKKSFLINFSILLALPLLVSCEVSEENDPNPAPKTETIKATLNWSGEYAVDGCGFTLQVGTSTYKPTNESEIATSYKTADPTPVQATIINYRKSTSVFCGFASNNMNSVKIVKLERL